MDIDFLSFAVYVYPPLLYKRLCGRVGEWGGEGYTPDRDRNKTSSKMSHSISNGHLRERHTVEKMRGWEVWEKNRQNRQTDGPGKKPLLPVLFEINWGYQL